MWNKPLYIVRAVANIDQHGYRAYMIDILIAHSNDRARLALQLFLAKDPCLQVIGCAQNDHELLSLVISNRPDLVLMDWRLPGSPAAELVSALRAADDDLKIIVLISRPEQHPAVQQASVDGIINLWEPPQMVLTVIRTLRCADG